MSVAIPEPSMPSCLSRRPAASMIRRLVACFCSFPYRAMRASTGRNNPLPSMLLYYDRNSIRTGGPKMTNAKPVALVTGASSGIGKAASLALVESGLEVVGTSATTLTESRPQNETDMNDKQEARGDVVTSYKDAPTRTVSAGGVNFAYRELGPKTGVPV